ncbi:unnamed protein product [Thelazia callipaeda]|uniref:CDGSH iron-sulfur domain-containing protein 3, mitochondrial n=1 Tax=Thelazia callipaeda TaxID=103827 RepID=A0A0N5D253_THECL|nr:unnamed protein product [Thelazia callipaeda]
MVSVTLIRRISTTIKQSSGKSGWGPYRQVRKGDHFVGTEPHPLKYHMLHDKKPLQKYGLQGTHHLLPGTGKVNSTLPIRTILKKDKIYAWCSCGYSGTQPLCDGSHLHYYIPTKLRPVRFIPDKDMEVWFCNCKQTKTRPFCDGSHREVRENLKKTADDSKNS